MAQRGRVALVLAAMLLAGCSAAPDSDGDPVGRQRAVPPLAGWVLDEAKRPLAGVVVELQQTGNESVTDGDGRYRFFDVPRDLPLVVVARHEGYQVSSKQLTLAEGHAVHLNFTMAALVVKRPYLDVLKIEGLLSCEIALRIGEEGVVAPCMGSEAQDQWDVAAGADLAGIVVELAWTSTHPAADSMRLRLETLSLGDLNHIMGEAAGTSILRVEVPQSETSRLYPDGGLMRLSVEASTPDDGLPAGAAAHVEQDFEVFVSFFYVDPAPAGYSVTA